MPNESGELLCVGFWNPQSAVDGLRAMAEPALAEPRSEAGVRSRSAGPIKLLYGNTRASRAKVDKRYAADPRFV